MILPRQARDKHRENSKKEAVLSQCIEWLNHPIPSELWAELKTKGLIGAEAPTPA